MSTAITEPRAGLSRSTASTDDEALTSLADMALLGPPQASTNLTFEAQRLERQLWGATRFTKALEVFLGFGLVREPCGPALGRVLDDRDAAYLARERGDVLTYRAGYLVPRVDGPEFRVASICLLVDLSRLDMDPEQREQFDAGTIPLGRVLADADRHTHYVRSLRTTPDPDRPVLVSCATLVDAGRPVALVREAVYWRTILHVVARNEDRTPTW